MGRHSSNASDKIISSGVMAAMLSLICRAKHKSQMAGLQVLASLAQFSDAAAQKLMSPRLLTALQVTQLCAQPGALDTTLRHTTPSCLSDDQPL